MIHIIIYSGQTITLGFDTHNANGITMAPDALPVAELLIQGAQVDISPSATLTVTPTLVTHHFIVTVTLPTLVLGNSTQLHMDWLCATLPQDEYILEEVYEGPVSFPAPHWGIPGITNLRYIREVIIKETGRYDLVGVTAGVVDYDIDNGVDFYIIGGQHLVCDYLPDLLAEETWTAVLAIGTYKLYPLRLKVPQRVTIADSSHYLAELEHVTHREMDRLLGMTWANVTPGCPMYFTFARDITTSEPHVLYVLPITNTAYDLTVHGLFYPPIMIAPTDCDWITAHRPWLLIKAAEFAISRSNGVDIDRREADFLKEVDLVDKDSTHRDITEAQDEYGNLEIDEL